MDFSKIFKTLMGKLSVIFLLIYSIFYVVAEIVFASKEGGTTIYYSIFFIIVVLICSVISFLLLIKLEEKYFLYILLNLPVIVFCGIRFVDLFAVPLNYIAEIILMISSVLLVIAFLVTAFFTSEKRVFVATEKKREEIVKSVLETQDKYQKALERKRAEWENVIEEED